MALSEIKIIIEFSPFLKEFTDRNSKERHIFEKYLRSYIESLLTSLKIPTSALIESKLCNDPILELTPFKISINGHKCRLMPTMVRFNNMEAKYLASLIGTEICRNRELLLTILHSKQLYEKWSSDYEDDSLSSLPLNKFHHLLIELIR
jgi:hypothetical protein